MKFGIIFISVIVLLFSSGCKRTVKYKTVDHYNEFEVLLPDNFKQLLMPQSNAPFKLGSRKDDFYITISSERIDKLNEVGLDYDLEMYANVSLQITKTKMNSTDFVEIIEDSKISNGMGKISYSFTDIDDLTSEQFFYSLSFFKGDSNFYAILTWCLESDKEKHIGTMKHIHSSFKEK